MMITAELKNWSYDKDYNVYFGNIFNDIKNRYADGRRIHTSGVVREDKANPEVIIVHTKNSIYLLRIENRREEDGPSGSQLLRPRHL